MKTGVQILKNFIFAFSFTEYQPYTQQNTINDEHRVIINKYIFKNTKSRLKLPVTDCWGTGPSGFPETSGRNYRTTQRKSPEYLILHMKTGHQLIKSFSAVSFPLGNKADFPHYLRLTFRRSPLSLSLSLSFHKRADVLLGYQPHALEEWKRV